MTKGGKRKVKFQTIPEEGKDQEDIYTDTDKDGAGSKSRRFKDKHSLDSDEELEEEKIEDGKENVLHEDDIEGQEDETIRNDEGITLTPFNLKDELEEGHFDAQGNYIANKDADATDEWLESVDWKKVENIPLKLKEKMDKEEEEPVLAPVKIMQDMIEIMKPGENVLKCLRRLGGNKKQISSADRWKKKKQNVEEPVDEKAAEDKANLLKLTGLADDLLQAGDFQIYEKTYEQLKYEVNGKLSQFQDADEDDDELEAVYKKPKLDTKEEKEKKVVPIVDSDDDDDDDDDELEAAFTKSKIKASESIVNYETKEKGVKDDTVTTDASVTISDEVCWFYKLEDNDSSELLGPYTSETMLKMQEDGKFGGGVLCRKVGSEGSFYNSNRIDFDLYT